MGKHRSSLPYRAMCPRARRLPASSGGFALKGKASHGGTLNDRERFQAWLAERHARLDRMEKIRDELETTRRGIQEIHLRLAPPARPNLTLAARGHDRVCICCGLSQKLEVHHRAAR